MDKVLSFPNCENESTDEQKAIEIIYDAYENESTVQRKRLARKALEVDSNCAEAYCLLAEEYDSVEKQKENYLKGIVAFKNKHGEKYFLDNKGAFWGLFETRIYMRLCAQYGELLWEIGEHKEALKIYEELLVLNPNDNQGLRYHLINWFIFENEIEKAEKILEKYKEGSGFIRFCTLLIAIKKDPFNSKINKLYKKAIHANSNIVDYLLGDEILPDDPPEYFSFGDDNEAIIYCQEAKKIWENDKHAIDILVNLSKK